MAERRMFAKTIIDSDAFLDMPLSTQALYFHLSMRADDDGFINNPKKIQRMVGATDDDLKLLAAKNFIIPFESGVVVIKHWKIHNYIRNDRKHDTKYLDERSMLSVKENGAYTIMSDMCQADDRQLVDTLDTEVRLGKDSIGKVNNNMSDFESEFEALWKKYPRKDGKKKALVHYIAARRKGVSCETISDGIDRYVEYIKKENVDARYIKMGSSWFCGHCWDDEYKAAGIKPKNKFNDFDQREYDDDFYADLERKMMGG